MIWAKRLLLLIALLMFWFCIVGFGAIRGWWLSPVAPKGDTEAFWAAATKMAGMQSKGNIAMVLVQNGEIVREQFQPSKDSVNRNTVFPLASTSKWIAAYGVMQLVQAGKIDLDAPVSQYLTRWKIPPSQYDLKQVTVRRLLSHTAGLTDRLGFGDYELTELIPPLEQSLQQPRASRADAVIAVGQEPGRQWQYSGGGYLILQLVVEEVVGMSFARWMQQAVFDPLSMKTASYASIGQLSNVARSYDASGTLVPSYQYAAAAATGLSASLSDLVQFAKAQAIAPRAGLNQANVNAMREPHGRKLGADIWGLGVMLYAPTMQGNYVFGHDGANHPAINVSMRMNPDNGDAIIVLVTGHPKLASAIGYEWTLWQTGVPDFLMLDKAIKSAIAPMLIGLLCIVAVFLFRFRKRGNKKERAEQSSAC